MSDIIQLLPDHVANQIAAGEVVQRPASVVKELLENSIDAQATRIDLLIKDAGKTLIQISDDGIGMSTTDARLSFERHATSKIKAADDLFQLKTKGFRGEALASIAAISHIDLKTKEANAELGTHISIEGSKVMSQEACVTPTGTVVSVKNLFYNIPARRNFLKSDAVEMRHIIDEFQRVALAHPQVVFNLYHNDAELFQLNKANHRQRIVAVFGGKTNEQLVPVEEETEVVEISGFVGKPEFARRTRGQQFFFVNNRFIRSPYLNHAVNAAYEGLLQDKQHASYFLFLNIDTKSIDINIHPTKTEIKFDDEHAIYAIIRAAVKHSLGQFDITPSLDFDRNPELDTPYEFKNKNPRPPQVEVDRDFNPFKQDQGSGSNPFEIRRPKGAEWEGLYAGLDTKSSDELPSIEFESETITGDLFSGEVEEQQTGMFQLQKKYIVSALKGGMLIINQHRAHYRVLYEEFLKNITVEPTSSQQLLFPLILKFSLMEIEMLKEIKTYLEQIGFDFENITAEQVKICGIPGMISESQVTVILDQVLSDLENNLPENQNANTQLLAQSLAKNTAIRTGVSLNLEEQSSIVNQLFACKEPDMTPDNEKVYIRLSAEDLDKNFV
ncbi:MAG TPA: DNA mismatch repair endonuclease MutL [Flavobacteriaceae bacterium]|nr:DNA mismatch repair endonuclease MutL [Flavobacteriaceae bacterium]